VGASALAERALAVGNVVYYVYHLRGAVALVLSMGCTPAKPEAIVYDADGCAYCRMQISDPRFGAALVTVNELVKTVHENESIYIPIGAVHRLENPGKILLELIEVQTGSYLGEDDIIRIEDDYQRS